MVSSEPLPKTGTHSGTKPRKNRYSSQNTEKPTPERAVLVPRGDSWEVLFTGDGELERYASLVPLVSARGDGHATVDSQQFLSPQERARLLDEPARVDGGHFDLILAKKAKAALIDFLQAPP